jgi:hypothetical protein
MRTAQTLASKVCRFSGPALSSMVERREDPSTSLSEGLS